MVDQHGGVYCPSQQGYRKPWTSQTLLLGFGAKCLHYLEIDEGVSIVDFLLLSDDSHGAGDEQPAQVSIALL
jgi:hypothetical protein